VTHREFDADDSAGQAGAPLNGELGINDREAALSEFYRAGWNNLSGRSVAEPEVLGSAVRDLDVNGAPSAAARWVLTGCSRQGRRGS